MTGWIGVDLDGTLAFYDEWRGPEHVGAPIMPMVERVRAWLTEGRAVKIFTARIACSLEQQIPVREAIYKFCREQFGTTLPITCSKDFAMIELWDDRCVQVIPNTGRTIADARLSELTALEGKP